MTEARSHIVLETKDLSIGYKSKQQTTLIAANINMSLVKGELVAIVGANGVGKSTLLRTLSKIQPALQGSIFLNEKELSLHKPLELASQLSLVLTEQIPSRNLTVVELIGLSRQPYTNWLGTLTKADKEFISKALTATHTAELADKKCYQLSDGQFQKVMIARALAQDTSLIILDEPTTHLDMYHKAYVLNLLKKLAKTTRKSILFSTHEIDLAIQLSDKLLVITENASVFGTPKELIEQQVFSSLFPDDLIVFDEKSASFKVKK